MPRVFIAWGGNQSLAKRIADNLKTSEYVPVVGGGTAVDMYVGNQVIEQMCSCDRAILLIEDYENRNIISPNLLFEWGFLAASKNIVKLHIFMINKSQRDLPSDLLGVWVEEVKREDDSEECEKALAEKISNAFIAELNDGVAVEYFDIINSWANTRQNFAENIKHYTMQKVKERIIFGCLAAYYYGDNKYLREQLNHVNGPSDLNVVVLFAKAYIDVFLNSDNMASPLKSADFLSFVDIFEAVLAKTENSEDNFGKILRILCYDVYGLACILYLKNNGLDAQMISECKDKALSCSEMVLNNLAELEKTLGGNKCLFFLIRAYIYNDLAELYKFLKLDEEMILVYIDKSVESRKSLYLTFNAEYPENEYLAAKLEQEYMIALSNKCLYMKDGFAKSLSIKGIKDKYNEWKAEADHTGSLIKRLENNLKKLENGDISLSSWDKLDGGGN